MVSDTSQVIQKGVEGIVTFDDGVKIRISAIDQVALIAKARELVQPKTKPQTAKPARSTDLSTPKVLEQLFVRNMINKVLSGPGAAGELLAIAAAGLDAGAEAGKDLLTGQPTNFREDFAQRKQSESEQFPASLLKAIPKYTEEDLIAFGQSFAIPKPGQKPFSERF